MNEFTDKMSKERESLTPKTGFNIVIFDGFSPPGEMLTLVDHVETREEAEKIADEVGTKEFPAYIYGGEDEVSEPSSDDG